jgi:hypothetical protein
VSKVVRYPEDPPGCAPAPWVAHWAHPLEAEWLARGGPPPPGAWPVLTLQARAAAGAGPVLQRAPWGGWLLHSLGGGCPSHARLLLQT